MHTHRRAEARRRRDERRLRENDRLEASLVGRRTAVSEVIRDGVPDREVELSLLERQYGVTGTEARTPVSAGNYLLPSRDRNTGRTRAPGRSSSALGFGYSYNCCHGRVSLDLGSNGVQPVTNPLLF